MISLVLSIFAQLLLVVLLLPLSLAWCVAFVYWITFVTVWQMAYRLVPVAVVSYMFTMWLSAFEATGSI